MRWKSVGAGIVLALAMASGVARAADEKPMFGPADQRALAEYRVSMDTAKRCYEAWKAVIQSADKNPALAKELAQTESDEEDAETIADMLRLAESRMPNTGAALSRRGCTMRDTIMMFMEATAVESADLAKQMGGDAKEFAFLPPETVAFFEKNGEQLRSYVDEIEQLHREKFPDAHKDDD